MGTETNPITGNESNEHWRRAASMAREVALEFLWPTRCAVCDLQGEKVLCAECEASLLYIDDLDACPACGAPYGRLQCTECNAAVLEPTGLEEVPFDLMRHSVVLDDAAKQIVAVYKDGDERRLSDDIARILSYKVSPEEIGSGFAITFIPDTLQALRRRGFDHSEEIASKLSAITGLPLAMTLERPTGSDQRALGRAGRFSNMIAAMTARPKDLPRRLLLIDDVCTTGATIYSACVALREAGAESIHVLTFGLVTD